MSGFNSIGKSPKTPNLMMNSAVNPMLYAFTNDFFKKAFAEACGCQTAVVSLAAPRQNATASALARSAHYRPSSSGSSTMHRPRRGGPSSGGRWQQQQQQLVLDYAMVVLRTSPSNAAEVIEQCGGDPAAIVCFRLDFTQLFPY